MNNDKDLIKRLNFENFIWITFIIVAILDIYGVELIKKSIQNNNAVFKEKADNLFLFVGLISLIIYIYFLYRNYTDYKKYYTKDYSIRLFGSIFVFVGTLCLFYFQLSTIDFDDLPSNI